MEATVKKTKRSVLKREKRDAKKEAAKTGPVTARLVNVPTSPRKMRLVADLIRGVRVNQALSILKYEPKVGAAKRGVRVNQALSILKYEPKVGAAKLEKLLLSAISNWEAKNTDEKLEEADLFVKDIFVDGGRILKRLRPAPQGRAHRIRKRSNHVTLVVDSLKKKGTEVKSTEKE
jgi:large subunit ribosomal protein L22